MASLSQTYLQQQPHACGGWKHLYRRRRRAICLESRWQREVERSGSRRRLSAVNRRRRDRVFCLQHVDLRGGGNSFAAIEKSLAADLSRLETFGEHPHAELILVYFQIVRREACLEVLLNLCRTVLLPFDRFNH